MLYDFRKTSITVKIEVTTSGEGASHVFAKIAEAFRENKVWEGSDRLVDHEGNHVGWLSLKDNDAVDI